MCRLYNMDEIQPIKLPEVEGAIDLIFGQFGGGKSYLAVRLMLRELIRGVPVYSSFPIDFKGYDERGSKFKLFLGLIGLKRRYKVVPKENFHHITYEELMSDRFVEHLSELMECVVVVDEAYAARLFDSYRKTNLSVEARMAVYATRHFDRRFIIVAQRPNSIHVSSRAMVNRFYKCDQPIRFLYYLFGLRLFTITEYQEMKDETIDDTKPLRTQIIFGKKKIFKMYNSKFMRGDRPNNHPSKMQEYSIKDIEIIKIMFGRQPALAGGAANTRPRKKRWLW